MAIAGVVTATYRRHYAVRLDDGREVSCVSRGRSLGITCGDRVAVTLSGTESVIESIGPRMTLFFRSDAYRQKLIAANVTQLLGIVAPDPPFDDELVHRWIIAAESNGSRFVLIANKQDLPEFKFLTSRLGQYTALGYEVVPVCAKRDVSPLMPLLSAQRSVLVGQSGMGKSTLINALVPNAAVRVGELSKALQTGRHTTSQTTLYPLGEESWIIDSPGMKEFGLAHLAAETIEHAFVELRPLLGRCKFRDCRHGVEPGCAVQEAVTRGQVKPWRVALVRQLLAESERRARTW